jgi:hypothetical protein
MSHLIPAKVCAFASLGGQLLVIPGHMGDMTEILPAMDMLASEVLPMFL